MKNGLMKMAVAVMGGIVMMSVVGCGNSSSAASSGKASTAVTKVVLGTQEMPNDEGNSKGKRLFFAGNGG